MTLLVRGRPTALAGVPSRWSGPLPDLAVTRQLEPRGGFTKVPLSLLHGGVTDLGVVLWALLRLSFQDRAEVSSYRDFADALALGDCSDTALDKRFGAALRPLLGTWVIRKRRADNECTYAAAIPADAAADRYAILRRFDLELLSVRPATGGDRCRPADLADFCRWQLECGRRGWTADPLRAIAGRWGTGHTTLASSRDRLARLGLLEVVQRSGRRYSDLIWLKELYDPYWQVASTPDDAEPGDAAGGLNAPGLCTENGRSGVPKTAGSVSGFQQVVCPENGRPRVPISTGPIRNPLTGSLPGSITDLGGTSVPPDTSPTREHSDAPPAASSSKINDRDAQQLAARLIHRRPVLAAAQPHFRRAMIRRLSGALERGLDPGHADRALARVADERDFDAECLLLQRALQQARADQLAGMCAECGGAPQEHWPGCSQFEVGWVDDSLSAYAPDAPRGTPPAADPLEPLLQRPLPDRSELTDDAVVVEWMIIQLAQQLAPVSDREASLRNLVAMWRAKSPPGQQVLLDQAADYVRYALARSIAS